MIDKDRRTRAASGLARYALRIAACEREPSCLSEELVRPRGPLEEPLSIRQAGKGEIELTFADALPEGLPTPYRSAELVTVRLPPRFGGLIDR